MAPKLIGGLWKSRPIIRLAFALSAFLLATVAQGAGPERDRFRGPDHGGGGGISDEQFSGLVVLLGGGLAIAVVTSLVTRGNPVGLLILVGAGIAVWFFLGPSLILFMIGFGAFIFLFFMFQDD
jgi:hypothetical protein